MKNKTKKQIKKSCKGIFIRVNNPVDIIKIEEFKRKFKLENKTKPFHERKSLNEVLLELFIKYIDGKFYDESSEIITNLLLPLIKRGFKNQLNDLVELIILEFQKLTSNINQQLCDVKNLEIFVSNIISLKLGNNNELNNELNNPSSIWFKKPKWMNSNGSNETN